MKDLKVFQAYAAKFEEVYVNDDWRLLEPYFHEDVIYHMIGEPEPLMGREAVFAGLKKSLDTSDRRFKERTIALLAGPEIRDGAVWFSWRATYRSPGLPELVLEGEETLRMQDGRIILMKDQCPPEIMEAYGAWMAQWGDQL